MLYGPNTNVGSNSVIFMLEAQAHYVVRALRHMRRRRKSYVAVRAQTMADFIARSTSGWTARCGPPAAAATSAPPTAASSRSGRAVRVTSGSMTRRFRPADYAFDPPPTQPDIHVEAHAVVGGDGVTTEADAADVLSRLRPGAACISPRAGPTCRLNCLPAVRDSLNARRRESAAALDTAGVDVVDAVVARRRGRAIGVRIYRGGSVARPCRAVLPFRCVRARQPRHRPSAVRRVGAPRTGARWCPSTTAWPRASVPRRAWTTRLRC